MERKWTIYFPADGVGEPVTRYGHGNPKVKNRDRVEVMSAADCEKAIADRDAAVRLLNDAQTTIIDTDLRREWEAERARLRAEPEMKREPKP